jgi:uncharacterized protein YggE
MFLRPITVFAFLALPILPASADDTVPTIVVTETASVQAKPDRASVSVSVAIFDIDVAEAISKNNEITEQVLAAVKEMQIEERDISTASFNVREDRSTRRGSQGFLVTNRISVRIRDITKAGEVLSAMFSAGANEGGQIRFSVTPNKERNQKLRRAAVEQARERAEGLAEAAGTRLGRVVNIRDNARSVERRMPMNNLQVVPMSFRSISAIPIALGEHDLGYSVTVTWELLEE